MMIDGVLHRSVAVADPRQSACRCYSRHIRNGGHSDFIAFGTRPVSASKNSVPGALTLAQGSTALALVIPTFGLPCFRDVVPALQLFRIESERLKLPAPFSRRITQPLNADTSGQAAFYCGFDKIGFEEGERGGHTDLPNTAFLASAKFCDRGYSTCDDIFDVGSGNAGDRSS